MNFAKKCKELRMKKAVTQEQMAAALNISAQAISKWENGLSLPDITMLPELSVYFGVTIDELFDITDDKHLTRIQNMIILQDTIDDSEMEYAQNFLFSQIAEQKNVEDSMQLVSALYNRKAEEYRKKAEYYSKEALAMFPDNHNNHSNLNEAQQGATSDWNLDNQAERIAYYKEFLEKHPESKESWHWYIGTLLQVGRCEEAAEAIDKVELLCKKGNSDNTYDRNIYLQIDIYRAQLLWRQGHHRESLEAFEKILEKYSTEWRAWGYAADAYAQACQYEKAIECYKHSFLIQPRPRYTDAAMATAQICEIRGNISGAIEAWKWYISILGEEWNTTEGTYVDRAKRKIAVLEKILVH